MAKSPRSVVKRGDFTRYSGRSNYPQRRGTRPSSWFLAYREPRARRGAEKSRRHPFLSVTHGWFRGPHVELLYGKACLEQPNARGDRRISLLTSRFAPISREIRRVHSVVIRQSAAEPDEPFINMSFALIKRY